MVLDWLSFCGKLWYIPILEMIHVYCTILFEHEFKYSIQNGEFESFLSPDQNTTFTVLCGTDVRDGELLNGVSETDRCRNIKGVRSRHKDLGLGH